MKNKNRSKSNIDPIAIARKQRKFKDYAKEAKIKMKFALEVYNRRRQIGLTQEELAKAVNSTQKVISNIEHGQVNVGLILQTKIAETLNIPFQYGDTIL